jgi:hypothetical protein
MDVNPRPGGRPRLGLRVDQGNQAASEQAICYREGMLIEAKADNMALG